MADEIIGGGGWTLDPSARHAMLLDAGRTALAQGDHAQAVVLAEELLDEDPDDVEALLIVADAAPRYGHGEVGALAAAQAARRGATIGALEAAALLTACQVERALEASDVALARNPDDARAHAVRGQALELLGRVPEGEAALRRAAALRPEHYPLPLSVDAEAWDTLLLAASSGLDREHRDALRGVTVVFVDLPELESLRSLTPPPSPLVDALLIDPDARRPRLELYRRNILRGSATTDELEERIREALRSESDLLLGDDGA